MTVPNPTESPTLTVEQAAKIMNLSRVSAYNAVKAGEIPSIRVGRRILVPTAALLNMLGLPLSGDAA